MMNEKMQIAKRDDENDEQYIFRVCSLKDQLGYTWEKIGDLLNQELGNEFNESAYRKKFQSFQKMLKSNENILFDNDGYLKEIQAEKDELYKIKKQVQDQRREYNKLLTADARADHLAEKLIEAADKLAEEKPLDFSTPCNYFNFSKNDAILFISDIHYGMIADNIWNKYDTDICKQRIKNLVTKTIKNLDKQSVDTLHIVLLGDLAHGAIHTTARVSSEEDTCDQLMHISEIIAETINELSKYVNSVNLYSTYGNHLRTVQNKKESIHSDNMEKIVPWWLKQRLKENQKVKIIDSEYYEFILLNVCGYNVLATHGDLDSVKNVGLIMNTVFNKAYGENIDYVAVADKHHIEAFEQAGIEATLVGSLCGTDEYANNRRLYSAPSQTLMIFNQEDGKVCQYNIKV